MRDWLTTKEIAEAALPGLPTTPRGVLQLADREAWASRTSLNGEPLARRRQGRGGGTEYHRALLPPVAQAALAKREKPQAPAETPRSKGHEEAWDHFERQTDKKRAKARERLAALETVLKLQQGGLTKDVAVRQVSEMVGASASTIYGWFDMVAGVDRSHWLPCLLPRTVGRTVTVECDPRAWAALKADYLRLSKPSFATAYRRVEAIAKEQGWSLPSARTLERRVEAEIPKPVRVLLREGREALMRLYPPQERDRSMFHAMEAVNVDGHKWDVFVRWPDGTVGRPMMAAIQDLYSNKVLAWRVDRSENSDLIRLTFADLFRDWGIPDQCWMDNGRGFAAKCISGGTPNRFRFKVKPEEPSGILTTLGIELHWTTPYSGQSKPLERAFRDLCDAVAKHPQFEGAYPGNRPDAKPENYGSKAIPIDTFLEVVEQGIRLHNAQPGRNTRVCGRVRSFDQAFEESYATALVRRAGPEQLRMCLLAAEALRTHKDNGAIQLLGNRYWAEFLVNHANTAVTVRFDPDNLHAGVSVYRLDGVFLGDAECWEAVGFADSAAARDHAAKRRRYARAIKDAAELERSMDLDELLRLLPEVDEPEAPAPAATRLVTLGNLAAVQRPQTDLDEDEREDDSPFFRNLEKGLRLVKGTDE